MTPADRRAQDFKTIHGLARLLGLNDEAYRNGMATLLRPGTPFDPDEAWANVRKHIVDRLMTPRDLREMKKGVVDSC